MALLDQLLSSFLANTAEYALICTDPQGIVVGWLGAAEAVFGYTAEEMFGQPLRRIFTPEDRERNVDGFELLVAARTARSSDDRWHLRKDGARVWVSGTVQCLRNADGQVLGFVKVVRDRTDVKAQIERLKEEVSQAAGLREHHRAFLSTLGHEMRNSLSPLVNAAHILSRTCTDEKSARTISVVARQTEVLRKLAEDLLDLSRAGTGGIRLQARRMDLRELLQSTADSLRPQAQARKLAFDCIVAAHPLPVDVDPERFERVVLNLVGNALKYTPAGGKVWVKALEESGQAVLQVQDTGIGIAPEVLPRVFELFTQEAEATEMAPAGLGVGLAIVKQLVDLHGGTIQARSSGRAKGAEFTVRLPLARDDGGDRP